MVPLPHDAGIEMNRAIATRLTRLEQAIRPSKLAILVVQGAVRAMWPKSNAGQAVMYVQVKKVCRRQEPRRLAD